MGGTMLSSWEREHIAAMLREGKTLTAAALETGRSLTAVQQIADDYGIEYRRNPRIAPEVKERVRELLRQKASFSMICKQTGVSLCTARRIQREGTGGRSENVFLTVKEAEKPETAGTPPGGGNTDGMDTICKPERAGRGSPKSGGRAVHLHGQA